MKICVRAECSPLKTFSTNGELAESASSSGRNVRSAVVDRDRAVGAADADVDVEAEGVVAPDDVAEQLVVAAVVRRVDDPLVLPVGPRVRAGRAEREPERLDERGELRAALGHAARRTSAKLVAATGLDLDLGCDQLADEMRLDGRPGGRRLDAPRSG